MALTPGRWLAALAVVLLASMTAVLPPGSARNFMRYLPWGWQVTTSAQPDALVALHNQLLSETSLAGAQLVLAHIRDSVLAQPRLIREARRGAPQIYLPQLGAPSPRRGDPGRPSVRPAGAFRLTAIQAALDSAWRDLPRRDPSAWALVVLVGTPLRIVASGHEANLALADGGGLTIHGATLAGGCVLVLDAHHTLVPAAPQLLLDRLAPCRWQAAFGAPSDSVAAWLERQSWTAAYPLRWWLNRWGEIGALAGRRAQVLADTGSWGDSARAVTDLALWWGAVDAAGCYRGHEEACLRTYRAPARWGRHPTPLAETSIPTIYRGRVAGAILLAGLLDEVLESVGPERFHAFWTSDLAADSALAVALQQPLGPWLSARVARRLGGNRAESKLPPASAGISLVLAGLFIGGAVLASFRRRTP